MTANRRVTLFHAPNTRSTGALALMEELGADFELQVLNFKASEQRGAAYLAVNPMGKVPAVKHGDALITEQVAVFLYLADLYPDAGPGATDRRSAARPLLALDGVLRLLFRTRIDRSRNEA
jgi:glutathione S-transferase